MSAPVKPKRPWRQRDTHVYFAQCNAPDGPVKIGFSTDIAERLADLQVGCPYPITLLGSFKCCNSRRFEKSLHGLFADLHIRGEWYLFAPDYARLINGMREIERIAGDRTVDVRIERRLP